MIYVSDALMNINLNKEGVMVSPKERAVLNDFERIFISGFLLHRFEVANNKKMMCAKI